MFPDLGISCPYGGGEFKYSTPKNEERDRKRKPQIPDVSLHGRLISVKLVATALMLEVYLRG